MKTKVRRFSKRSLAVFLGVVMLFTCIGLGSLITVHAYGSATIYYTSSSSGTWASATNQSMSFSSTTASISLSLSASTTYRFVIVADNNDWFNNQSFDLSSQTSKTNNCIRTGNFSTSKSVTENPNTLTTSSQGTYVFTCDLNTCVTTVSGGNGGGGEGGEGGEGGGGSDSGQTTGTAVNSDDLIAVLKRTKIYIYFGDCWNDNNKTLYLVSNQTSVATGAILTNKIGTNSDVRVVAGCITPSVEYRITHDSLYPSWAASFTPTAAQAGYAFNNYNADGNKVGTISGSAAISWDTGKDSDSIKAGTASCNIKATATGSTAYASAATVKYFYTTNNTNFYEFNPNNTGGLTPGTYTIYAAAYDGNVYVAAASQATLTVKEPETTHNVTFSATTGGSISPSGNQTVGVTTKTDVSATPDAGYEFSSWETSGVTMTNDAPNGDGRTAKVVSTANGSVRAKFVAKKTYTITTKSNNNRLGSVSVSPSSAYAGQQVTVTFTNLSGTITSSSAKDADNGTVTLSGSNTSATRTFTMPAKAVTVTGNFTLYTGNADYYYNGYNLNTTATIKSGYYAKRMSEAMVNGQKFAYYHVTGRSESDQLFNISYGNLDYDSNNNKENGNTHVWWTRPDSWSDHSQWSNNGNQYVMFYSSDHEAIRDWTNMSGDGPDGSNYRFIANIPDGARYVRFKDGGTGHQTIEIDLKWKPSGGSYYANGYYLNSSANSSGTYSDIGTYNMSGSTTIPDVEEYYNGMSGAKYFSGEEGKVNATDNPYGVGTFYSHSAGYNDSNNSMGSHSYSKPRGLTSDNKTDYYVVLFYKNKSYTYNGVTRNNTSAFDVFWTTELPGGIETVTLYAKDGTVRWSGEKPTTTNGKLGDTVITNDSSTYPGVSNITSHNGTSYASDCDYQTAKVEKGMKFQITTTVEDAFKATHYVKAFMVNGKGAKFFTHSASGVYTMEYTVPEDFDGKTIEVTPVYYVKDESDTVTFKIEGFDNDIQTTGKWGTTLYAYPFYAETVQGYQSAFYGYPGQPVIEDNGKYYIQIPIHNTNPDDTNHTVVRGITLSNGYLDDVHKVCESTYVVDHRQTYDYDDFFKIYNEKHPDNITFSFKYKGSDVEPSYPNNATREQKITAEREAGNNHRSNFSSSTLSFEQLTNYHGQKVSIFGDVLDTVTDNKTLYVISDGYWYNNAGSFGTEWCIFTESGNNYTYLGEIVPSALALNDASSFDKAAYAQSTDDSHGKEMLSSYKTFYNTLKSSYSDYQVKIIYEENIKGGNFKRINATNNQQAEGEDTAYRLDGRWTYSNDDDIINANIQIRYLGLSQTDVKDSVEDTFSDASADKPVGNTTGATAYFTNSDLNQAGESYQNKMATGDVVGDKNKSFTFTTMIKTPKSNNYVFQGWYLLKDGKYSPMTQASTPMNATETYVALYRQSNASTITVSHSLLSGSGDGFTEVKLEVTGSADASFNKVYDFTDEAITATIDNGSTVTVTLSSTSAGANTFNGWYNSDGSLLDNGGSDNGTVVSGAAKQVTLTPSDLFSGGTPLIRSKEYFSDFHNVTHPFKAVFHYTNRAGQNKTYTVKTTLDTYYVAAHTPTTLDSEISEGVTLRQWVKDNAPKMIDLFGKNIKWTMTTAAMNSGFDATNDKIDIQSTTEVRKWKVMVETHSNGIDNDDSTKDVTTVNNVTDNTYVEKSGGGYFDPVNTANFKYWVVYALDVKNGTPKNDNELLRIYNYEFKAKIAGDYYVKAVYTPGTVTRASVQEAVYSREVYDMDATGDTKQDDLYADFIYSYMSSRNSVELYENDNYISGIAIEVSQNTKIPDNVNKTVDYSEYTFDSTFNTVKGFVENNSVTSSTANGTRIGTYTYTESGKADDKRAVYCYPIVNKNYNNFNRGDMGIKYDKNASWNKYIMKAYYYVKDSSGNVVMSEPVYFCLHNTKVTVYATSNAIVES